LQKIAKKSEISERNCNKNNLGEKNEENGKQKKVLNLTKSYYRVFDPTPVACTIKVLQS
jgi:hypothetical protein